MRTDYDVVIVGAGPAGSTAATLLARAGRAVALVERQPFPRRKVCGECIAASNLPLLEALGIGPAAFAALAGPPLRNVAILQGDRTVVGEIAAARSEAHQWGRALGRETLDPLLLERARAAGATVLQPWSVLSLSGERGDHRCLVQSADGERAELRAPLAILAHGSWEPLRADRADKRRRRRAGDLFGFKADFRDAKLPAGVLPVLSFPGGYGGMVVADGGITTVACCVRADRLKALRAAQPAVPAGDVVEAMLKRACAGVAAALDGAVRDGPWLASPPLDPGIRLRPDDTVLRIGNAAGEAHPIIGEGMSMAMQSAWILCGLLLAAKTDTDVAARYEAEWRRQFAGRLRLASVLAHGAMRPRLSAPLLALAARWPRVLTAGSRWSGKVRCAADAGTIDRLAAGPFHG